MTTHNKTQAKLLSFAYLPIGWNFNRGVPAEQQALKTAFALLEALVDAGFKDTDAFPAEDGSVMVSAYVGAESYDFDVKVGGTITVVHTRRDEDLFYQEGMQPESVKKKIKEFALQKWPTYDYSIFSDTTLKDRKSLLVMPSKIPLTGLGSQSFTWSVPTKAQVVSVVTVFSTTPKQRARPSSSGKSRRRSLRIAGRPR